MYKEHPVFKASADEDITVWRYMDFTKLVDLLEKQALFFPRADKLGDPFEGSYPKANIPRRPVAYGATEDELKGLSALNRRKNERWTVSCWHMNDYGSDAM